MAYPPITSLGTVPQRTQTPAEFATNADSFLGALPNFRTELNAFGAYVDAAGSSIDSTIDSAVAAATAAAGSATASALSAASALAYKDLAAGTANFKGSWSALTGALAVPASVYHNGLTWVLLSNLANVTTAEPGVSASWVVASGDSFRRSVDALFKRATLDLDFSANSHKVYEQFGLEPKQLQSVVVTVRNSTATYQSPTGLATAAINTPRITYDAANGNALGLLVEEQRTNLLLHSQYTAASGETPPTGWNIGFNTGTTTTASSARFAGAIRSTQSGTAQREHYAQPVILAPNTTYTLSAFFASRTSADGVVLSMEGLSAGFSGTVTLAAASLLLDRINSITFTTGPSETGATTVVRIGLGCTANATGTVIHETPQLEVGPAATSYIPTTTAQVTRNADVISRALTTTNANAGALYAEVRIISVLPNNVWAEVLRLADSAPTAIRGIGLQFDNDIVRMVVRDSAGTATGIPSLAANPSALNKVLCSFDYATNTALIAVNGVTHTVALGASGNLNSFSSHLFIGYSGNVAGGAAATSSQQIKRCTYFPRSFTAAEAQAITS